MHDPWRAVTLGLCLAPLPVWPASAAELPRADEVTDYLAPSFIAEAHPRWTAVHRREAAVVGDVFVWPSVTVGAVFDSNPYHTRRGASAAAGAQFVPTVLAERDTGVHHTLAYATGDVRVFPAERGADTVNGRAGVLHDWSIAPDLTLRGQGEIARRTDPFNATQLIAATARDGLFEQSTVLGSLSVQKTFERVFVTLSGSALRSTIHATNGAPELDRRFLSDETVLTLKGRVGAWVMPGMFGFVEPGGDWRKLDALRRGSDGSRVVAGLGFTDGGLWSGEAYAGRQAQRYADPRDTAVRPVVGGRLRWAPTPVWTVTAVLDQSLGDVAVATAADRLGTPTRESLAFLDIGYALSPLWTARVTFGAAWIDYLGTPRRDTLALADLHLDYSVSRSMALTGALRLTNLQSSFAAAAYQRADATLGATYHY